MRAVARCVRVPGTALALVLAVGCAKKENDGLSPVETVNVVVRLMEYDNAVDDSLVFDLSDMTVTTIDGIEAVPLDLFVPEALVPPSDNRTPSDPSDDLDRRGLYAYRIVGADGYSAYGIKGKPDNRWAHMCEGGIATQDAGVVFEPALGLPRYYAVDNVAAIEIYRKVDLVSDTDTVMVELAAETRSTDLGDTAAVALAELVDTLSSPAQRRYTLVAVDGFTGISPFGYDTLLTGYWLLDQDRTQFAPDLGGRSRIRQVREIEAVMPGVP